MSLPDSQRRLRAQIASNTSWGNTGDRTARTEPGRQAMGKKFEDEVDRLHPGLSPAERAKRVESLRKAHFQRLAFRSANAARAPRPSPTKQPAAQQML